MSMFEWLVATTFQVTINLELKVWVPMAVGRLHVSA